MAINSCMPLISVEAGFSLSFSTSMYCWKLPFFFFFLTQQCKSQHTRDSFSNFSFNSELIPLFSCPHVIYSSVPHKKMFMNPFLFITMHSVAGSKKKALISHCIYFTMCKRKPGITIFKVQDFKEIAT